MAPPEQTATAATWRAEGRGVAHLLRVPCEAHERRGRCDVPDEHRLVAASRHEGALLRVCAGHCARRRPRQRRDVVRVADEDGGLAEASACGRGSVVALGCGGVRPQTQRAVAAAGGHAQRAGGHAAPHVLAVARQLSAQRKNL